MEAGTRIILPRDGHIIQVTECGTVDTTIRLHQVGACIGEVPYKPTFFRKDDMWHVGQMEQFL